MILVVEIPHASRPRCWFAFDEEDFVGKARGALPAGDGVVFRTDTPRALLAAQGLIPDSPGLAGSHPALLQLATEHGWDTTLYRADYMLAPGLYQSEPVSEFLAWVGALAHGLKACRVYMDERQAMDELYADALYAGREGFYAHMALREQLVALEVLSDDM
jgi:hypothetical protein